VINDVWEFSDTKTNYKIKMRGNRTANDDDLVRRWCVAGKGLAVKSCLDISNDLLSGRLVNVMPEFKARATELWIVCPSRQSLQLCVYSEMHSEKKVIVF